MFITNVRSIGIDGETGETFIVMEKKTQLNQIQVKTVYVPRMAYFEIRLEDDNTVEVYDSRKEN